MVIRLGLTVKVSFHMNLGFYTGVIFGGNQLNLPLKIL
nr:MAG TPA: hypothetical protein [Bacteriophage sp.]